MITRQELERRVIRAVAENVFKAGHKVRITLNGEDDTVGETEFHTCINKEFIRDCTCADLIDFTVHNSSGDNIAAALLVGGNSGYDIVADCTQSFVEFMPDDAAMDSFEETKVSN